MGRKVFKYIFSRVPSDLQKYILSFIPSKITLGQKIVDKMNINMFKIIYKDKLIKGGRKFDYFNNEGLYCGSFKTFRSKELNTRDLYEWYNGVWYYHDHLLVTCKWYGRIYISYNLKECNFDPAHLLGLSP